eukprot:TRINITY_DN7330_c0_g1_i1.p1 TRINITY_DN7330_c0_g1~~TRINITY_DN7330_c0_g1_i1.p1  ORF type:complete len:313 (+),score=134.87 TRINITY_DN7330_c0_g1_i1:187-1125(+)
MTPQQMTIPQHNTRTFKEVEQNGSYHPVLLHIVARVTELHQQNDAQATANPEWPAFDGLWAASVTVNDYTVRLCKYAGCSPNVFAVMAVYLDRAGQKLAFTGINVHRVLLAAFIVAAKFLDDQRVSLQHYGNIAGLPLADVRAVEAAFLECLEWDLYVSPEEAAQAHTLTFGPAPTPPPHPISPTSSDHSFVFSAESGSSPIVSPEPATPLQLSTAQCDQMAMFSLQTHPQQACNLWLTPQDAAAYAQKQAFAQTVHYDANASMHQMQQPMQAMMMPLMLPVQQAPQPQGMLAQQLFLQQLQCVMQQQALQC